ncbi:MAG: hydrogenase, partial [Acidobacteria bacterium]|nr:hydrogenase [Acidobacteriota bacterium]
MEASQYPKDDFRAPLPIIGAGESYTSITDQLTTMVLTKHTPMVWFVTTAVGFVLLMLLFVSLGWLFAKGIGVWGNNAPVGWAFDI